jgi:sugar O-acyltransferase (sialic acid O-acetyltransferase NeuD family)
MDNIIIIGSSGQARVVIDIVRREGRFNIAGLIDRFRTPGEQTLGYSVLGGEEDIPHLMVAHGVTGAIIAIGDNFVRASVACAVSANNPGLGYKTAVHPSASIGMDVEIGDGSVVMAGAVVNSCTRIGNHCILNSACSLDHDSVMADYSSLAPGVVAGGYCKIGEYSAVGIGATLRDRVHIGAHSIVGAGALVMKDVDPFIVAYGVPARKIRSRKEGERYV